MGVTPIFSAKAIKFGRSHISQTETREGIVLVFHFFCFDLGKSITFAVHSHCTVTLSVV